jgi:hypothetical protein
LACSGTSAKNYGSTAALTSVDVVAAIVRKRLEIEASLSAVAYSSDAVIENKQLKLSKD